MNSVFSLICFLFLVHFGNKVGAAPCATGTGTITITTSCEFPPGVYYYDTLIVNNGATVSIQSNTTLGTGVRIYANAITIQPTAVLNGKGFGYLSGGPGGAAGQFIQHSAGAGHAGMGGDCAVALGGSAYGRVDTPDTLGSAGGSNAYFSSAAGGSAIALFVNGTLTLNGAIDVSGNNGGTGTYDTGGGAGGSIWIEANVFTGSGVMRSNGGDGGTRLFGGGGSGGRISVRHNIYTFTGTFQAFAGSGFTFGGRGTFYLENLLNGSKALWVDNNGRSLFGKPAVVTDPNPNTWVFDQIYLRAGGHLLFQDNDDTVIVTSNSLFGDSSAYLCSNGTLNAATITTLSQVGLCTGVSGVLTMPSTVTINGVPFVHDGVINGINTISFINGASAFFSAKGRTQGQSQGTFLFSGNCSFSSSSTLTSVPDTAANRAASLTCNNLSLGVGCSITGTGYGTDSGPGFAAATFTSPSGGAGHSGQGGISLTGGPRGVAYGSLKSPTALGSGGGSTAYVIGGSGGGAIRLVATNILQIDGTIDMSGSSGLNHGTGASGAGSGGSIWIDCNTLTGSGIIRANGGNGGRDGTLFVAGGGSAGRIAIFYSFNTFSGAIENIGGIGSENGGRGTVYLEDRTLGTNALKIDNAGSTGQPAVIIDPAPTVWTFTTIDLRGYGHVTFNDSADSLILTMPMMLGDGTSQLCTNGFINASTVNYVTNFGLCSQLNGILLLPSAVTFDSVRNSISGVIRGVSDITLTSSELELYAAGRSFGQTAGTYQFPGTILLQSASFIRSTPDTTTANGRGIFINCTTMRLETGTSVIGRGFGPQGGPGVGTSTFTSPAGGAGHSGLGGRSAGTATRGNFYGLLRAPVALGSGGGTTAYVIGGSGGGAFRLTASTLYLDGTIDMSGSNGIDHGTGSGGAGSGGSIWIDVGVFDGSGIIRANGGNGGRDGPSYTGGAGSAGRIAIFYTTNTFAGAILALAGVGWESPGRGTIYILDRATSTSFLNINNQGIDGLPAVVTDVPPTSYVIDQINLRGYGHVTFVDTDDRITIQMSNMLGDGTSQLCGNGIVNASTVTTITNFGLCSLGTGQLFLPASVTNDGVKTTIGAIIRGVSNIDVVNGGTFELTGTGRSGNLGAGNYAFPGNIYIGSGSFLLSTADTSIANGRGVTLNCSNLNVDTGGEITGVGFPANAGPGVGTGASYSPAGGAGHSGTGGRGVGTTTGGTYYGLLRAPVAVGSGGGNTVYTIGGNGGSAIRLSVSGTLTVSGEIDMSGFNGLDHGTGAGGAGSGGSIWIDCNTLAGDGFIRANGGNGGRDGPTNVGGGGSAGRIAIYSTSNLFSGAIRALPGMGFAYGGRGTIFMSDRGAQRDTFIVDSIGPLGQSAFVTDPVATTYRFDYILMNLNAHATFIDTDDRLILVPSAMAGDSTGQICSHGLINASSVSTIAGHGICCLSNGQILLPSEVTVDGVNCNVEGILNGVRNLTLQNSASFTLSALGRTLGQSASVYDFNTITLRSNSVLMSTGDLNLGKGATIYAQNFFSALGTNITTTGFNAGTGTGAGGSPSYNHAAGGSHGGRGGNGTSLSGPTYGSDVAPVTLGSGGGNNVYVTGGNGGGAVLLVVNGTLDVNGRIQSSGDNGRSGTYNSGGGSGGSVWLIANCIGGTGIVVARGGNGINPSGGGGGGRVRIEAVMGDVNLPSVDVSGGASGAQNGTFTFVYQTRGYCRTPITTGVYATTASLTSQSVTTGEVPVTSGESISTGEVTTSPVTSGQSISTGSVTTSPVTTEAPATTDAITSGVTEMTTGGAEGVQGDIPSSVVIGAAAGGGAAALCCLGGLTMCFVIRRRKARKSKDEDEEVDMQPKEKSGQYVGINEAAMRETASNTSYTALLSRQSASALPLIASPPEATKTERKASEATSSWEIEFSDLILEKEIGRGHFGSVFKGKWRGGDVAVKKLISVLNDAQLVDFKSEANLMSRLRPHTNVVQFIGACTKPGQPLCIVTEFLEGGSLWSYLKSPSGSQMNEAAMVKIVKGIVAGMVHLIEEKIVHRDLAARNILLTGTLVPKVSDFGMSRFANTSDGESNQTGSIVGPLRWMSPESLADRIYSEKTDVYSFGILVWEIAALGALPYPETPDPVQVASRVVMGRLKLTMPTNCPPLLSDLIKSCTSFQPEDRPTFKAILSMFPIN